MEIRSEDDVDKALAEMGRLKGVLSTIQNSCNAEVEVVKRKFQNEAICEDGAETVTIPEQLQRLEKAIAVYCEAHKGELIPDPKKSKTKTFTHGKVSWAEAKRAVVDDPAEAASEVRKTLLNTVITAVISVFSQLLAVAGLGADRLFNFDVTYNRNSILDLYKKKQITDKDLSELGLKVKGGEDELSIKPATVTVTPHPGSVA